MFALARQETDRGKTKSKRKALRHGGNGYECMVLPRTMRTRQRARVAHTLGHALKHSIDGAPCQDVAAIKEAPHVKVVAHVKVAAHIKEATHVKEAAHVEVAAHIKEAHHAKESGSSTTYRSGAKDVQPVQAKPPERSTRGSTCAPCKPLRVKTDNKANRTEETSEVAKTG